MWRQPRPEAEVTSLAQHFGVPTALLDFTENPRIAMFWATVDVPEDAYAVSVWALDSRPPRIQGVELPQHPRSRNPHLLAQEGVLVYMTMWDDYYEARGMLPSLETYGHVPDTRLRRFDLPVTEVGALRRLLDAEGLMS